MTEDLARRAEARAGLAALFGLVLLEEPGGALAGFETLVPELAAIQAGGAEVAAEYERVFLRGVPLHEGVFRNDDARIGGAVLARVVASYEAAGYTEHRSAPWRVPAVDHLGVELRCYAHLCRAEAEAWRSEIPDEAVRAVEAEREFMAERLVPWAGMALDAVARVAAGGPYAELLAALCEFFEREVDRLRPAPLFGVELVAPPEPPQRFGPARLARWLLAPATCGCYLDASVVAAAAAAIGSPWRPSDGRSVLRQVLESAADSGELAEALGPLRAAVDAAAGEWAARALTEPGAGRVWRQAADRAAGALALLVRVAATGFERRDEAQAEATLVVRGADEEALLAAVERVAADLRAAGFIVE